MAVRGTRLKNGYTKSCGCYAREKSSERLAGLSGEERSRRASKHGQKGTRLYDIWHGMKQRCTNENDKAYKNYGGRGVQVCAEWMAFEPFFSWALASGYEESLTLERVDVNGDYEPSNCTWVTKAEQQANKRTNVRLSCRGETHCVAEWSRISGVSDDRISHRLSKGWDIEDAIFKPVRKKKKSGVAGRDSTDVPPSPERKQE